MLSSLVIATDASDRVVDCITRLCGVGSPQAMLVAIGVSIAPKDPDGTLIEIYARLTDAEAAAKPADEAPVYLVPGTEQGS